MNRSILRVWTVVVICFCSLSVKSEDPSGQLLKNITRKKNSPKRNLDYRVKGPPVQGFNIETRNRYFLQKGQPLEPNHIYSKYDGDDWKFIISNWEGKLAVPFETILPQSVFDGKHFKGENQNLRYYLTKKNKWVPTKKRRVYYFRVEGNPPYVRNETFRAIVNEFEWIKFTWNEIVKRRPPKGRILASQRDQYQPLLYEGRKDKLLPRRPGQPLVPNRLYLFYVESLKDWAYGITNYEGKFPKPTQVLLPGTVLYGRQMGVSGNRKKFLNREGRWEPTKKLSVLEYLVLDKPPYIKRLSFGTLKDS